jgi:hypothetical protein
MFLNLQNKIDFFPFRCLDSLRTKRRYYNPLVTDIYRNSMPLKLLFVIQESYCKKSILVVHYENQLEAF